MPVMIVKATGERAPYSEDTIRASASRVGVPKDLQDDMLQEIRRSLYDGISTREIFAIIKAYLHKSALPHLAVKYNLKSALAEIGPSGYPFEHYVALLLKEMGYICKTNQLIPGAAVTHEIDVFAEKEGKTWFVEAKFHRNPAQRTDVRVALYIRARFEDISEVWKNGPAGPWIFTNTRFSSDAIAFAKYRNIKITSWGFPRGEGIMDLVERTKLFPITMLDGLTQEDKTRLLASKVVVCRQLLEADNAQLLPSAIRASVMAQIQRLCS